MIYILFKTKNLHFDNGEEFRNKVMENYLKENNIDTLSKVLIIHNIKEPLKRLIKLSRFLIYVKDHQGKILFSWFYWWFPNIL